MRKGIIYVYFNKAKYEKEGIEKYYVGQTMKTIEQRAGKDGRGYGAFNETCNNKFANGIRKWGWNSFEGRVLEEVYEEDLDELEKFYIEYFDSFKNGYNSTLGGEGTRGNNPYANKTEKEMKEIKEKISKSSSKASKKRYEDPKEREKISIAIKKRYEDPEERKKTGEAAKIALNKPEVKEKLSKSIKIALNKPEVKEKLSKIQIKRYEDAKEREKISKAQRKRYEDEKEREKTSIAIKKHYEDPKERERQSKAIKTSWENPERKKIQSEKLSGENNGTSKYHKVIINNKTIIGRYIDETINISKQYIDNINRNWFKKSKGIPNKFKNIVSIEEISREDYYMLLQSKNIISYVNVCK